MGSLLKAWEAIRRQAPVVPKLPDKPPAPPSVMLYLTLNNSLVLRQNVQLDDPDNYLPANLDLMAERLALSWQPYLKQAIKNKLARGASVN